MTTGELEFEADPESGCLTLEVPNESELTSALVKKVWDDDNDRDGLRTLIPNLAVELVADNEPTGKVIQLNARNNWIGRIDELPKMKDGSEIVYTWKEADIPGYSLTDTTVKGTMTFLTNTHKPELVDMGVKKVWSGEGTDPMPVKVQLYADGIAVGEEKTLSAPDWSASWTGLPKNKNPEGTGSTEIEYSVAETWIPDGYECSVSTTTGEDGKTVFEVTNTRITGELVIEKDVDVEPWEPFGPDESPMDIPVIKTWNDDNNRDGNRPESVTVRLLADGVEVANAELNEKNNWRTTFTGLPRFTEDKVRIEYTLKEDPVKWYEAEIHGYNIRNNYKPELTSVSVRKIWKDNNNEQGLRPVSIVMMLSNGMSVVLNSGNHWTATIENLPAWIDGKPAKYTWTEQTVFGYKLLYMRTEGTLTTFTNTDKKPETPEEGKKPKTPGKPVENIEDYDTPLGVEIMINHVGDCFD